MSRDWESEFASWAQSPSNTEQQRCDNAIGAIRNAISRSPALDPHNLKVFAQGSYRNRVNVRTESDVDIGVLCAATFYPEYPPGKTAADFGNVPATYLYPQFKNELEQALVNHFGRSAVRRGNKSIVVRETSYHLEADVVPFFEHRIYSTSGQWLGGVSLLSDSGQRIDNFPERLRDNWPPTPLHYENGVAKNTATDRVFKGVVRIIKTLRSELSELGIQPADDIPGYLIECLTWNVPDQAFKQSTWCEIVMSVLLHIWSSTQSDDTCASWTEVDRIKFLFHPTQKWTRDQVNEFALFAWNHVKKS